jgi:hypothetical protein
LRDRAVGAGLPMSADEMLDWRAQKLSDIFCKLNIHDLLLVSPWLD